MSKIYVIHENAAWLEPLAAALDRQGLPWADWFLDHGAFDLSRPPPEGVFYNRMSASSHTRDHRYSAELTAAVLAWLAGHGRRVVNGPRALDLEISKARQYAALEAAGALLQERREYSRRRQSVIDANPALQERELIKLAALASALAGPLRRRGVTGPAASLTAEAGIAVFKIAFERWISETGQSDLPRLIRESLDELRTVTAGA